MGELYIQVWALLWYLWASINGRGPPMPRAPRILKLKKYAVLIITNNNNVKNNIDHHHININNKKKNNNNNNNNISNNNEMHISTMP